MGSLLIAGIAGVVAFVILLVTGASGMLSRRGGGVWMPGGLAGAGSAAVAVAADSRAAAAASAAAAHREAGDHEIPPAPRLASRRVRSRRRASRPATAGARPHRAGDRRRRGAPRRARCASRSKPALPLARVWQGDDAARARARGVRAAARVGHRAQRRRAHLRAAGRPRRRDRRRPRHPREGRRRGVERRSAATMEKAFRAGRYADGSRGRAYARSATCSRSIRRTSTASATRSPTSPSSCSAALVGARGRRVRRR